MEKKKKDSFRYWADISAGLQCSTQIEMPASDQ